MLVRWLRQEKKVVFDRREDGKGVEYTRVMQGRSSVFDYVTRLERSCTAGLVQGLNVVAQEEESFFVVIIAWYLPISNVARFFGSRVKVLGGWNLGGEEMKELRKEREGSRS